MITAQKILTGYTAAEVIAAKIGETNGGDNHSRMAKGEDVYWRLYTPDDRPDYLVICNAGAVRLGAAYGAPVLRMEVTTQD